MKPGRKQSGQPPARQVLVSMRPSTVEELDREARRRNSLGGAIWTRSRLIQEAAEMLLSQGASQ